MVVDKGSSQGSIKGDRIGIAASALHDSAKLTSASGKGTKDLINVLTRVSKDVVNAATEERDAIDPNGKWEEIEVIIDSGATAPVFPPSVGKLYKVQASEGSRNGDEYRVANGERIPNLGEKVFPVVTEENTVRGITAQIADVTDSLQSVRHTNANHNGVWLYGDESFVINMLTGEVNKIADNGKNFVTKVWVIPPDEANAVMADASTGFPGPQK